jgi:hypothetical protein
MKSSRSMDLFCDTGAVFSPCGAYRYRLWRTWSDEPPAVFVMLNPSTADEIENDPTVERCERRARMMGFGGLRVANIFALRSTDPSVLYEHPDPVGPENDAAILESVAGAGIVVCAWGAHGRLKDRDVAVLALLRGAGVVPHYLTLTKDGVPGHPLYVSYKVQPKPLEA